ncbi:MAG: O-antigen ligase family protein [Planctomycetaceae bacterium]|nr:O-antigen ligase family protein [Planctomycetaceae bacterium]MCA9074194.1 O-antigen ligase family protein [Planctomycetaceae bacterium]
MNAPRSFLRHADFWSWFIAAAVVLPVSWNVVTIHNKPIDVLPSDMLLLALPVCVWRWLRQRGHDSGEKNVAATWMYCCLIALIAYCGLLAVAEWSRTGDAIGLLSAAKFIKPLLFVFLGGWLATAIGPRMMLRQMSWMLAVVVLLLAVSTILHSDFPGTVWGSQWMGHPVYGFPNLAMTFVAAATPLVMVIADTSSKSWQRWFGWAAAAASFVLVVSSLSRCANVVLVLSLFVYLLMTGRRWRLMSFACVAVLYVGTGYSLIVLNSDAVAEQQPLLQERAAHRFVEPVNRNSGALAGRSTIWAEAWSLIRTHPWVGYAFRPYSYHSEFVTPHQQYLETLYKAGAIGFAMYAAMLLIALGWLIYLWRDWNAHATRTSNEGHLLAAVLALLCGVLIGNLSQANLTYSLTGNCLFLLIGLMVHPRSEAAISARRYVSGSTAWRPWLPSPLEGEGDRRPVDCNMS